MPLLTSGDRSVLIETFRALGRIGDPIGGRAAAAFVNAAASRSASSGSRRSARSAASTCPAVADTLLDLLSIRARRSRARPALGRDARSGELSWRCSRASIRTALERRARAGHHPRHAARSTTGAAAARALLADADQRVIPFVLAALVKLKAPKATADPVRAPQGDDPIVRAAAATGLGELKPPDGPQALADAYQAGRARSTVCRARGRWRRSRSTAPRRRCRCSQSAFADKDWAVRVRAAQMLKRLDPSRRRRLPIARFARRRPPSPPRCTRPPLDRPAGVDPGYIDTDRGTIQIEWPCSTRR
jgi:hypothetical protein